VLLATRCALASPRVSAAAIEATAFPGLVGRLGVLEVPAFAVDDMLAWSGRLPEQAFVERLVAQAGSASATRA
jgi:hypothetical protein